MPATNQKTLRFFWKVTFAIMLIFVSQPFYAGTQSLNMEYAYKHYSVHDGLAQMQVMSLFQDHKGYLWCVTKAGLSRFDGQRFKNYTNSVLPGFDITIMGESIGGRLLLFGSANYAELKGDSINMHEYPQHGQSSSIFPHSLKHKQKALLITSVQGKRISAVMDYSKLDSLKIFGVNQDLGSIVFLEEGDNNYIWQCNRDTLFVSDVKSKKLIRKIPNPKQLTQISQCGSGFIGINNQHKIYQLKDDAFELLFSIEEPSRFIKIIPTPVNDALIVKTDQNLYYFKNELVPIKQNLTQIRDLLFDTEDNLWVSTEEGLYNFFQLDFVNYSFNMGNKDWVWSVLEDDKHNFWFASYQNGLWKWDGVKSTDYTKTVNNQLSKHLKRRPVPEYYRYYMGASKLNNALFFPTECNVLKYENESFSAVNGLPELPFQMTKTYVGETLLCSGYPGLFEIKNNKLLRSWNRDQLKVSSVVNFERCGNDSFIVIGQAGVSLVSGDSIKHFENQNTTYSYSLAKDHKNNIWIGGIQHLNIFRGDSVSLVKSFNEEAFYSLLFVQPHYLFLGGIKGLYLADLNEYYQHGNFETILFNQNNGFTGVECGQNGFLTDTEGKVWIPTSDLVTRFDPQRLIERQKQSPRIYLHTSISSDNIKWQTQTNPQNLELPYSQNNIRFNVDAVSFANSGKIRYYYQLDGLQNNWSEPSESNEIIFYKLRAGTYEFKVKADAGISNITSEILRVKFKIEKPFWLKWWFIVLGLIVLHGVVLSLIYSARKREKQKAATQQRLTQLRSEALAAQLDPHFVMNCLNNISGLVNADYKQRANDYIVKFSKLLRVILQSVKKESISLSHEIEIVTNYLELERFRCNECFTYSIALPSQLSTETIMVPPMMLQPLVENSIKHGFGSQKTNDAHIDIKITVKEKELYICIQDNGQGLKKQSPTLGTGLGTKITRERIELLQASRNIHFQIFDRNPGAEVKFRIPLVINTDNQKN